MQQCWSLDSNQQPQQLKVSALTPRAICWLLECLYWQGYPSFFGGHWASKRIFAVLRLHPATMGLIPSHLSYTLSHQVTLVVCLLADLPFFSCHWTSKCNFAHCETWTTNLRIQSQFTCTLSYQLIPALHLSDSLHWQIKSPWNSLGLHNPGNYK